MVNSRAKGKRGELQARDAVRKLWGCPNCIRAGQANGSYSADLLGGPKGLHLEVKHYKKVAALDFLRQATEDATEDQFPVVIMREDGETSFAVMFWMEDSWDVCQAITEAIRASWKAVEESGCAPEGARPGEQG